MCAHAVYTHSCAYNANGPEWTTERFRVYIFVCRLCGAQILAIFETLTTLGNSRVTFQLHLNEKYVSSCVAWIVIKRVLRTPTVSVEVDLWMERRRVARQPSARARAVLLCTACNSERSPTCTIRGRQLSFIGTTVTFATWKICNLIATEVTEVINLCNEFFVWRNLVPRGNTLYRITTCGTLPTLNLISYYIM